MLQRGHRRSVVVAEDFSPLQKVAGSNHALELCAGREVILPSVLFRAARSPRRIRNRKIKPLNKRPKLANERRLARARRRRNNKQYSCHLLLTTNLCEYNKV